MIMVKKVIVPGDSSFKSIIEDNKYYVDKTMLIHDLIIKQEMYALVTRPRRFGKTLNQVMLRDFFDVRHDNRHLFKDLSINNHPDIMDKHCNQHPTIFMTFNECESLTLDGFKTRYKEMISDVYKGYKHIREKLDASDKKYFDDVVNEKLDLKRDYDTEDKTLQLDGFDAYKASLRKLSDFLYQYYDKKIVILIDEYDVPINKGFMENYFKEIVDFFKSLFVSSLKNNENIQLAVLTGCLRISKESVFTGLNNLNVYSVLNPEYAKYYGFTQEEVNEMAKYFNLEDKLDNIKLWYDGYNFGGVEIYNPWSICKYVSAISKNFISYWVNTSNNDQLKELIVKGGEDFRNSIKPLLAGGYIEKTLNMDVDYKTLYKRDNNIYAFLVSAGYLKATQLEKRERRKLLYKLELPNEEIVDVFSDLMDELADEFIDDSSYNALTRSIIESDVETFEGILNMSLQGVSFFDTESSEAENPYHLFIFGKLFERDNNYVTLSNRESGNGRYDIILKNNNGNSAIIIELKRAYSNKTDLEELAHKAIKQINEKGYKEGLKYEGYDDIKIYGVALYKKQCRVVLEE